LKSDRVTINERSVINVGGEITEWGTWGKGIEERECENSVIIE